MAIVHGGNYWELRASLSLLQCECFAVRSLVGPALVKGDFLAHQRLGRHKWGILIAVDCPHQSDIFPLSHFSKKIHISLVCIDIIQIMMAFGDIIRLPGRQTSTGKMSHCLKMEPLAELLVHSNCFRHTGHHTLHNYLVHWKAHCTEKHTATFIDSTINFARTQWAENWTEQLRKTVSAAICLLQRGINGFWWQDKVDWKDLWHDLNDNMNWECNPWTILKFHKSKTDFSGVFNRNLQ